MMMAVLGQGVQSKLGEKTSVKIKVTFSQRHISCIEYRGIKRRRRSQEKKKRSTWGRSTPPAMSEITNADKQLVEHIFSF